MFNRNIRFYVNLVQLLEVCVCVGGHFQTTKITVNEMYVDMSYQQLYSLYVTKKRCGLGSF